MKLAISPCPNDTFIFRSIVHGRCSWVPPKITYDDIETLNRMALQGDGDVLKVSAAVAPLVSKSYVVLPCGGAMGYGCGPLLLCSSLYKHKNIEKLDIIYLPGEHTTAAALFRYWSKQNNWQGQIHYLPYDQIYRKLTTGEIAAGVVIHENRFTFKQDGLHLLIDLGSFWESSTGFPVPLGVLLASKKIKSSNLSLIINSIQQSLQDSWNDLPYDDPWIASLAQIRNPEVIRSHVELYVSNFSYCASKEDVAALEFFWNQISFNKPKIWNR